MQNPFIEIELSSFGSSYKATTATSKKPDPSNPNFLERIMMPVALPLKSIFATPLQIRALDTRLGGWLKPIVGVSQIDLSTKIPWCLDTYRPPQMDFFAVPKVKNYGDGRDGDGGDDDEVVDGVNELQKKRNLELSSDELIAQPEPVTVDQYIRKRIAKQDTGAGVFGAINFMDSRGNAVVKKTAENVFDDKEWILDEGDQPPEWLVGRDKLESELEVLLQTTPFETYSLTRGHKNGILGSHAKVVGKLKGLVRVVEDEDAPPLLSKELMDMLLKPKKYIVRLYALRGIGLAAMDTNLDGSPGKSDPYMVVKLGSSVFNDRKNAQDDLTDIDLYKMVQITCELPGTSQLKIALYDKDLVGFDDKIGETVIDLEDRWFDDRWQQLGRKNLLEPGQDPKDPGRVRWCTKPIERRTLTIPSKSGTSQGVLEMYMDIMRPEEAAAFPPDDIALPPTQIFEVRVVIWKCKDVPPMDTFEGMSDLFVKCWPEGCAPQETDTHWRAKKGIVLSLSSSSPYS